MPDWSIPVDLFNPGQVFACLGFMEVALELDGEALAGFDWSEPSARFWLRTPAEENPFACVLSFLESASVTSIAPESSPLRTDRWDVDTEVRADSAPFPIPEPGSPATLPALLSDGQHSMEIAHWGDGTQRDNVKFWAGAGGYPGVALLRDALEIVRGRLEGVVADPFAFGQAQSSSFRFDWRRDYIPIDVGFSLNEHGNVVTRGYPVVEILAAIGLTHARPMRETKLRYHYGVVGRETASDSVALPPPVLRAALGATMPSPFPVRSFSMSLGWPGQENQARCITTVTEESR